jgi:hypothetical protein
MWGIDNDNRASSLDILFICTHAFHAFSLAYTEV